MRLRSAQPRITQLVEGRYWDNQPSVPSLWQLRRGRRLQRPWGWSFHNITLLYTTSKGNSWTPLVMENSAATKEADSCVIVIVNKNKTLWWTQFCLSDASTEMTSFWILLSARIFKPSHNTLQYLKSLFLSKLYLIRQNEKTKTAIISGKVGPNISANQYYKHEVLPNDALHACMLCHTVVSYSLQLHRL